MAIDIVKFVKGLIATNETDFDKQLQLQVSDSATTQTTTILQSAQTANRVITLPDSTGTLLTTADEISRSSIAPGTANRVVVNDGSGDLSDSDITTTELNALDNISSNIQTQLDEKADRQLSNLQSPVLINQSLTPATTDTYNIGSASNNFNVIYGNTFGALDRRVTLSGSKINLFAPAATDPLSGNSPGDIYYNTTTDLYRYYNGTSWEDLGSGGGGGANQTLSNLNSPTSINQDLIPDSDATRNLGSSSDNFQTLYVNEIEASVGNLNIASESNSIIDMTAQSVKIPTHATNPAGIEGCLYYNTTNDVLMQYNGSAWVNVGTPTTISGSYSKGGTQSLTTTTEDIVTFDVEFQTNSYYNVGTGEFTVPSTGTYYLGYEMVGAGTIQFNLNVNVNGILTRGARGYTAGDGTVCLAKSSSILQLTAGQIITLSAANISSTTRNIGGSIGPETSRFFFYKIN